MNKMVHSEDFIVIDVVWENQRRIKKQQLPLSRNAKKIPVEFTNEPDNLMNNLVAGRPQFESTRPLLEHLFRENRGPPPADEGLPAPEHLQEETAWQWLSPWRKHSSKLIIVFLKKNDMIVILILQLPVILDPSLFHSFLPHYFAIHRDRQQRQFRH